MISSVIKKIFAPDPFQLPAHNAYVDLVEQARSPYFYNECGIADTLDGRFDIIVLHMFLLTRHIKDDEPEFLRAVWEVFFSDMDRSLREMGASDTGIGKRIKKMAQAFYGRIDAYSSSIENEPEFKESLKRNLYRNNSATDEQVTLVLSYIKRNLTNLKNQNTASIIAGNISWCN